MACNAQSVTWDNNGFVCKALVGVSTNNEVQVLNDFDGNGQVIVTCPSGSNQIQVTSFPVCGSSEVLANQALTFTLLFLVFFCTFFATRVLVKDTFYE